MTGNPPGPAAPGRALSQEEIAALVAAWYHKLDVHAPVEELLPLVAAEGLQMQFPEGSISGVEAFRRWYEGVIRIFFDEVHTVNRVSSASGQGGRALVQVEVNWQARRWRPPAAHSDWLGFDAYQDWEVIRSPSSGQPVILRYIVTELKPMRGSAPL